MYLESSQGLNSTIWLESRSAARLYPVPPTVIAQFRVTTSLPFRRVLASNMNLSIRHQRTEKAVRKTHGKSASQ
jgi:hypothetical protein